MSERSISPSPDYRFTSIGVLITVLGQEFKEEFFERVLHEHMPWRKVAMAATEYVAGKSHYHMVALCKRPNMWLASNIEGQLGHHAHLEELKSPSDAIRAMAYLTKHQTPKVWGVTPVVVHDYKLHVLNFIVALKLDARSGRAKQHYETQYMRTRLAFFPPEKEDPIYHEVHNEDPDEYFK